ncbi:MULTISPECIES: hypothetical protein [Streptomyces]|uniref:hypothetical protein n=1 Tax=Streptomyces TaxID=1883 RepID=UPI001C8B7546|nr:hypothetical protein [Streptomyces lateritius]
MRSDGQSGLLVVGVELEELARDTLAYPNDIGGSVKVRRQDSSGIDDPDVGKSGRCNPLTLAAAPRIPRITPLSVRAGGAFLVMTADGIAAALRCTSALLVRTALSLIPVGLLWSSPARRPTAMLHPARTKESSHVS